MDIYKAIQLLSELKNKVDVQDEKDALDEAIKVIKQYDRKREEQIDFQGWPLRHQTMNDLREFMRRNKSLDGDTKILVLEDDGMAYGARNGYCTEISVSESVEDKNKKEVHIWY